MASKKTNNTRELLLDSAFNVFYKNGFQGSNILEILENVNINKGSMYYYFKSKKDLALGVIKERIAVKIEKKYTEILSHDNVIDSLFQTLKSAPKTLIYGCPLNKMSQEMVYIDKDFAQALSLVYTQFEKLVEDIIYKAIDTKKIKKCNIKSTAKLIIATYEGALMIYHLNQNEDEFKSIMNELEQRILI